MTKRNLFEGDIVRQALRDSFRKLDPRHQMRNPVVFVVFVGSLLTAALGAQALAGQGEAPAGFILSISLWLWFTVLFGNFAEAMAEGRGKRWQDVFELIDAGIDVYTTLNVQHLDSLNDVVAQITGIVVRETLPDSVLDQADDIELIDLPVEELRKRMEEGKVYVPDQAQRAMTGFFRPGNLIALRELALRRTADRVDAQMRLYRWDHSIRSSWPVTERLIVSVGPSPFSAKLIRSAKRIAERLDAEWIVAYVETPAQAGASEETRRRVQSALRLGDRMGAETVTLTGPNVADALLDYARSRNVSRIVLGKQAGPLWKRLWRGSVFDDLVAKSGDIEIIAISGETEAPMPPTPQVARAEPFPWREVAWAAAIVALTTAVSIPLRGALNPVNLAMFYFLGVVAVAMRSSRGVALFSCVLSVAAFDLFCVPPYLTFAVSDYEYLLTFAVMLIVAGLIASLTIRVRLQAEHASQREARTQALYRLTRQLSSETRWMEAARAATTIAREVFGTRIVMFFPKRAARFRLTSARRMIFPFRLAKPASRSGPLTTARRRAREQTHCPAPPPSIFR
ncbi:MAG: DUF4118 domain-containing protein [Bryobacteraceae bacterium]|nr:DUF4118 domain-containing protein [Bryobacteraceae bacterium]